MASRQNRQRQSLLTALIAFIALTGIMAGALTRTLITSAATSQGQRQNLEPTPTATATLTPQLSPTPTNAPTVAPVLAHFTLKLTVSPASNHAGGSIVINVLATDDATGAPIPGLTCRLRAPSDGAPGLLSVWPTPTATDSSGVASWTSTIPADAPGRYEIEAFAQTPAWSYVAHASVVITAS